MLSTPGQRARRIGVAVAVAAWLGAGALGAYAYLHRYVVYRGYPTPVTPAGVRPGRVVSVRFRSPAIGRDSRYLVYLPPGYAQLAASRRRLPVFYLLHGYPGAMRVFLDVGAMGVAEDVLVAHRSARPMLLVMPEGKPGLRGGDTEWANAGAGRWMDYVLDVVRDVDRRFATVPDRQHRAIAGDSEGGYAAVNVALHHLGVFSAAESWSGYFTETPTAAFAGAGRAELRANSPAAYVGALAPAIRRDGFRAWLYQGRDEAHLPTALRGFAGELARAGADVHVGFFAGGHDWGLWRREVPRMLTAVSRWFGERPRRGAARLASAGRARSDAEVLRALRRHHRRCLARVPRPGVPLRRSCRRYRARVARERALRGAPSARRAPDRTGARSTRGSRRSG